MPMQRSGLHILLVVEDPDERRRLVLLLEDVAFARFEVAAVADAGEALMRCKETRPDLVLFDVGPGGRHLEDLEMFVRTRPRAACLALAGLSDRQFAERALALGAFQYCLREQLLQDLCLAAALLARRREALMEELEALGRTGRNLSLPQGFVENVAQVSDGFTASKVVEGLYGQFPLREHARETFDQLARRFMDLLELAMERKVFQVDQNISDTVRALADELCFLRAGPRDAVDVFVEALNAKRVLGSEEKFKACVEEGRLLLVELLGYMVRFYRNHTLGSDPRPARA